MHTDDAPAPAPAAHRGGAAGLAIAGVTVLAIAGAVLLGIRPRIDAAAALAKDAAQMNVPVVSVIAPKAGADSMALTLPGTLQPYTDAPILARTNGYVKRWTAEIGTHVKAGELLAELDTPEVDAQLQQARADLNAAEANRQIAEKTAKRWQELLVTGTVTRQDADQVAAQLNAREAAVQSARANVSRLEKLQAFKHVTAPFEGVVTARGVDTGALVSAGAGQELYHLAATRRLRVYVRVPQASARSVVAGLDAELSLIEHPGRRFKGQLVRTTHAIDTATRTLLAEVSVDNADGELLPGAYAQVHLKLKSAVPALMVPVNTLMFRGEGSQIAVVDKDQKVVLKTVTLGRDFGTTIEVLTGLDASDAVVLNPSDSLVGGTKVRVIKPPEKTSK
ncbi:MAG: efflux RND transporter periplasmic adaptor subunit [Burkholderiales bacterium]